MTKENYIAYILVDNVYCVAKIIDNNINIILKTKYIPNSEYLSGEYVEVNMAIDTAEAMKKANILQYFLEYRSILNGGYVPQHINKVFVQAINSVLSMYHEDDQLI